MILKNLFFFILAIFTSKDLRRQRQLSKRSHPNVKTFRGKFSTSNVLSISFDVRTPFTLWNMASCGFLSCEHPARQGHTMKFHDFQEIHGFQSSDFPIFGFPGSNFVEAVYPLAQVLTSIVLFVYIEYRNNSRGMYRHLKMHWMLGWCLCVHECNSVIMTEGGLL